MSLPIVISEPSAGDKAEGAPKIGASLAKQTLLSVLELNRAQVRP